MYLKKACPRHKTEKTEVGVLKTPGYVLCGWHPKVTKKAERLKGANQPHYVSHSLGRWHVFDVVINNSTTLDRSSPQREIKLRLELRIGFDPSYLLSNASEPIHHHGGATSLIYIEEFRNKKEQTSHR